MFHGTAHVYDLKHMVDVHVMPNRTDSSV